MANKLSPSFTVFVTTRITVSTFRTCSKQLVTLDTSLPFRHPLPNFKRPGWKPPGLFFPGSGARDRLVKAINCRENVHFVHLLAISCLSTNDPVWTALRWQGLFFTALAGRGAHVSGLYLRLVWPLALMPFARFRPLPIARTRSAGVVRVLLLRRFQPACCVSSVCPFQLVWRLGARSVRLRPAPFPGKARLLSSSPR
jgi:hypothetical protein